MSRTNKRGTSLSQRINTASQEHTYLLLIDKGTGNMPEIKGHISIGGAKTSQWKDNKQMYYWPRFRLAASETGLLYSFVTENGLIKPASKTKECTFGPLICKGESDGKVVAAAVNGVVSELENGNLESDETQYTEAIPVYDIEYVASNKKREESIVSEAIKKSEEYTYGETTIESEIAYEPEEYILFEKKLKKAYDATNKNTTTKTLSLRELGKYFEKPSAERKASKKTTKGSKSSTIDDLVERVKEKHKEGHKDYYMDVTNMSSNLTGGHVKAPTSNNILALPKANKYSEFFMLNYNSVEKEKNKNALHFYKLVAENSAQAKEMMADAIKADNRLTQKKKKAVVSKKTTEVSKNKKNTKTSKDEEEEEEEEDEDEEEEEEEEEESESEGEESEEEEEKKKPAVRSRPTVKRNNK